MDHYWWRREKAEEKLAHHSACNKCGISVHSSKFDGNFSTKIQQGVLANYGLLDSFYISHGGFYLRQIWIHRDSWMVRLHLWCNCDLSCRSTLVSLSHIMPFYDTKSRQPGSCLKRPTWLHRLFYRLSLVPGFRRNLVKVIVLTRWKAPCTPPASSCHI